MSNVTAEIKKITGVLLRKNLRIPEYQRPYRWSEKNVFLLLEDIFSSWKNQKSAYRIGSVILHATEEKELHIVDGQQRITTLVLILLNLHDKNSEELSGKLKFRHKVSVDNILENNKLIAGWLSENVGTKRHEFLN